MRPTTHTLTRRSFLASAAGVPFALRSFAAAQHASAHTQSSGTLWIGTYSGNPAKGIYAAEWNARDGKLGAPALAAASPNPGFLAAGSVDGANYLYAGNEIGNFAGAQGPTKDGSVSAFAIQPHAGALPSLSMLNAVDAGGGGTCHVSLDHTARCLFAANYGGGSVASFHIGKDGHLRDVVSRFVYAGHGPNEKRQTAPHTHGAFISPDNRFVLVNDLGLDRIMVYRLDAATARLTPNDLPYNDPPYYAAQPGSGPRHLAFHPNGRWAYSINELNSTIDVLAWDAQHGTLRRLSSVPTLPPEFSVADNRAAEVVFGSGGRFLYATNRGLDSVVVFTVDEHSGALTQQQRIASGGKTPRHLAVDPTGNWLLVANQDSNNIAVFHRATATGLLTATEQSYEVEAPICVLFA